MLVLWIFSLLASAYAESIFYDSFTGLPMKTEDVKGHIKKNSSFWCVNELLPCDPLEGRRVDGSCNNLKHPNRGMSHTPLVRLLPAAYDVGIEPRKSKSGDPLPLARKVRTTVLADGRVPDPSITQLFLYFWLFMLSDVLSVHDTVNYVREKTYCCLPKGKEDNMCLQIEVPEDDPILKFACNRIQCMNQTRPESFQSRGCLKNDSTHTFDRITTSTPFFDLSHLYGNTLPQLNTKGRLFKNGLLKFEVDKGIIWPPSYKTTNHLCLQNRLPHETRCHDTPEFAINSVFNINVISIWIWRLHNVIATELGNINPCWDDERIFTQTQDIVIAIYVQIYYYEFMPILLGYDNLVRDGILVSDKLFRDIYDESVMPQLSLEFSFISRWSHAAQEATLRMYDSEGNYVNETKVVDLTLRTGWLGLDNNLEYITHGSFRQPGGKFDYVVDPDMGESVLGPLQAASDVFTSDLTKNRYYGLQPYVKYREYCTGKLYRTFEELLEVMEPERVELIKERFSDVEDVDLIVNTWLENPVPGGRAPYTFYCLVVEQMYRTIVSDRHWYERPNRPNAFNLEQLLEIRKASMAYIMCETGDKVTRIQPQAFILSGSGNEMRNCAEIEKVNLWAWRDDSCDLKNNEYV